MTVPLVTEATGYASLPEGAPQRTQENPGFLLPPAGDVRHGTPLPAGLYKYLSFQPLRLHTCQLCVHTTDAE